MIKWLKISALLLTIILVVHMAEVAYDIMFHRANGTLFNTEEMHKAHQNCPSDELNLAK